MQDKKFKIDKKILRVLDANYNRCKEGLRVAEDIFRFIFEDDKLRKKIRKIRHSLDEVTKEKLLREAILTRDSKIDLGRKFDCLELKRENSLHILYVNLQRVKESLRVLEEFFKIILVSKARSLKKIRYEVYEAEKDIYTKLSLCNP